MNWKFRYLILHIVIGGSSLEAIRPFKDADWLVHFTENSFCSTGRLYKSKYIGKPDIDWITVFFGRTSRGDHS